MKKYSQKIVIAFTLIIALASLKTATAQTTPPSAPKMKLPPITLKVGDPAPPIVAAKWLKGEPVTSFKLGQVYVVEFWATWCGPCRMAMPHLSELAREYKGKVSFIGMDVQELKGTDSNANYIAKVENFVRNLGDGMDYPVATDVREATMWKTWMLASGSYGIPQSFVIDQQGKISWIGHAMLVDQVLPLVLEGKLDDNARTALTAANKARHQKELVLREELDSLRKSGNTDQALTLVDQLIENTVMGKWSYTIPKYELLKLKSGPDAIAYAENLNERYYNDPLFLQFFSDTLSKMESKEEKALAVKMMEQAIARSAPNDYQAYIRMASSYFNNGDAKKAVVAQEKVLAIIADTSTSQYRQETKDKAKEDLEKYKAAM